MNHMVFACVEFIVKIHNIFSTECVAVSVCVTDDLPLCPFMFFPVMLRRSLHLQESGYYALDGTPSVSYKENLYR